MKNPTIMKWSINFAIPTSYPLFTSFLSNGRMTRQRIVNWINKNIISLIFTWFEAKYVSLSRIIFHYLMKLPTINLLRKLYRITPLSYRMQVFVLNSSNALFISCNWWLVISSGKEYGITTCVPFFCQSREIDTTASGDENSSSSS